MPEVKISKAKRSQEDVSVKMRTKNRAQNEVSPPRSKETSLNVTSKMAASKCCGERRVELPVNRNWSGPSSITLNPVTPLIRALANANKCLLRMDGEVCVCVCVGGAS